MHARLAILRTTIKASYFASLFVALNVRTKMYLKDFTLSGRVNMSPLLDPSMDEDQLVKSFNVEVDICGDPSIIGGDAIIEQV